MFENLLSNPKTATDILMGWKWATEHPVLYTFIELGNSPYLLAVLLIVGGRFIGQLLFKKGRV